MDSPPPLKKETIDVKKPQLHITSTVYLDLPSKTASTTIAKIAKTSLTISSPNLKLLSANLNALLEQPYPTKHTPTAKLRLLNLRNKKIMPKFSIISVLAIDKSIKTDIRKIILSCLKLSMRKSARIFKTSRRRKDFILYTASKIKDPSKVTLWFCLPYNMPSPKESPKKLIITAMTYH